MGDTQWTTEIVEKRLEDAAAVLKRMPAPRVQGYFSLWPKIVPSFDDLVGQKPRPLRAAMPPAAIDEMEETLDWLKWVDDPELVRLLWARAEQKPWKAICFQFGIARATAHRRYEYALSVIAWRLNGRRAPTKRSRRYVIARGKQEGIVSRNGR